MAKLIISVQNATEARIAYEAGARMIDVKDPSKGSLGAASPRVWQQVVEVARQMNRRDNSDIQNRAETGFAANEPGDTVSVSVALGELMERESADGEASGSLGDLAGISFVKLGLSRAASCDRWAARLAEIVQQLPLGVSMVGVVYADWKMCQAPSPESVIRASAQAGCRGVLFDTFSKDGQTLFDHLLADELQRLVVLAHQQHLFVCLAGALRTADMGASLRFCSEYIAVRSAICADSKDRSSTIDSQKIVQILGDLRDRTVSLDAC